MSDLVWVHDAALRRSHPVFQAADGTAKAVYIWDESYLRDSRIGFNRMAFVLEALDLMAVEVHEGDTVQTLKKLCEAWGINQVVVALSPCPHLNRLINQVKTFITVTVVPDILFSPVQVDRPATRFFSYWNQVKPVIYGRIRRSEK